MRPLNHGPGREGGLKVAVQRAHYANRPRNKKKRHIVMRCVWAKGRAVGLEQSGAIKTGHGSEGPSRPSAARRWGEGGPVGALYALKPAPILSVIRRVFEKRFRPFLRLALLLSLYTRSSRPDNVAILVAYGNGSFPCFVCHAFDPRIMEGIV